MVDDADLASAEVLFRCPLAPRDRAASWVPGAVIDAHLNDEFRYATGSTYGVRASVDGPLQRGALQITTRAGPRSAAAAVDHMGAIVTHWSAGVSDGTVAHARGQVHVGLGRWDHALRARLALGGRPGPILATAQLAEAVVPCLEGAGRWSWVLRQRSSNRRVQWPSRPRGEYARLVGG